ncbi:hypothetical protein ABIB51_004332 [Arthrobacter sp. UYCu712]
MVAVAAVVLGAALFLARKRINSLLDTGAS